MWRLFGHCLFPISPSFGFLEKLGLMKVALPGYHPILFYQTHHHGMVNVPPLVEKF